MDLALGRVLLCTKVVFFDMGYGGGLLLFFFRKGGMGRIMGLASEAALLILYVFVVFFPFFVW